MAYDCEARDTGSAYQLGLTLAEYNTICMLFSLVHVVDSGEGPYMA